MSRRFGLITKLTLAYTVSFLGIGAYKNRDLIMKYLSKMKRKIFIPDADVLHEDMGTTLEVKNDANKEVIGRHNVTKVNIRRHKHPKSLLGLQGLRSHLNFGNFYNISLQTFKLYEFLTSEHNIVGYSNYKIRAKSNESNVNNKIEQVVKSLETLFDALETNRADTGTTYAIISDDKILPNKVSIEYEISVLGSVQDSFRNYKTGFIIDKYNSEEMINKEVTGRALRNVANKSKELIVKYSNKAYDLIVEGIPDKDDSIKTEVKEKNNENGKDDAIKVNIRRSSLLGLRRFRSHLNLGEMYKRNEIEEIVETLFDALGTTKTDSTTYTTISDVDYEIRVTFGHVRDSFRNYKTGFVIYKYNAEEMFHKEVTGRALRNIELTNKSKELIDEYSRSPELSTLYCNSKLNQSTSTQMIRLDMEIERSPDMEKSDVGQNRNLAKHSIILPGESDQEFLPAMKSNSRDTIQEVQIYVETFDDKEAIPLADREDCELDAGYPCYDTEDHSIDTDGDQRSGANEREYPVLRKSRASHRIRTLADIFEPGVKHRW